MANSYTNVFTGAVVKPSQVSYLALSISVNTALLWPTETFEGNPYVATQMDVTATVAALSLAMPSALQAALGQATVITNVGTNSFTLTDTGGNQIAVIAAGVSWLISLTSNSTADGAWRALQLASTTSSAVASSLAGAGMRANGSVLDLAITTTTLSTNTTLVESHLAHLINWTGGAGTLQLDAIANLNAGWFCLITNNGTGTISLSTTGGQTINGVAPPYSIDAGGAVFVVRDTANFNTMGLAIPPAPTGQINLLVLSSSGTFTTPANTTTSTVYEFTLTGGGGAGGGMTGADVGTGVAAAVGGAAGATAIYTASNLTPGTGIGVTIGAGAPGSTVSGAAGGNSSLIVNGTTVTAGGGAGGLLIDPGGPWPGAAGGVATNGTLNIPGGDSFGSTGTSVGSSGNGGASYWGGGGTGGAYSGANASPGSSGRVPGSGGGGSWSGDNAVNTNGGSGANGICVIRWIA